MNLQSLKEILLTYIQEKIKSGDKNITSQDFSDISLFISNGYSSGNVDSSISIFSSDNLRSLSDLDYQNGNFMFSENEDEINNELVVLINQILNSPDVKKLTDSDNDGSVSKDEATELINKFSEGLDDSSSQNVKTTSDDKNSLDFVTNLMPKIDKNHLDIMMSLFDEDKDGVLSNEEKEKAKSFISSVDTDKNNLNKKDLELFTQYLTEQQKLGLSNDKIVENIKKLDGNSSTLSKDDFNKISQTPVAQVQANSFDDGLGSGTMSSSGSTSPGSSSPSSSKGSTGEKNVNNMSIKDLEAEEKVAQDASNKAKESYVQEVEKVDSDLAKKYKDADANATKAEDALDTSKTNLDDFKTELDGLNASLSEAESSVKQFTSDISSLKNKLKEEGADTSSIQSKINSLQEEQNKIENEIIPQLQKSIEDKEKEIENLENNVIPNQEKELKKYQDDLAAIDKEISALATSNPSIKTHKDEYDKAEEYLKQVSAVLTRRRADQIKDGESVRLNKSDAPKDYSGLSSYCYDNLPMTYELDGKTYHCVGFEGYDLDSDGEIDFKPDSWEEVQRYFVNGGVRNLGKYGSMQCHNYSEMLGQFVLGVAHQDFVEALYNETNDSDFGDKDLAGKMGTDSEWNPRNFAKCAAKDRDEEHAIMVNELQNGRPCVIRVDGYSHYVAAVGLTDDGDILIWDSYEGAMERLSRSSNSDNNDSGRKLVKSEGVNVYCEGYSYQYGTAKAIDYWAYVGNSPEYVLQNGYK